MTNKICLIINHAPRYRTAIYSEMSNRLRCDFLFGDRCRVKVDYTLLNSRVTEVKIASLYAMLWQPKAINQLFKPYEKYILLGQPNFISTWIFLFLAKFTRKKTYLWTHGWYGDETSLKTVVKKVFFGLADGIFVYGDRAKELMIKEGFDDRKLFVIHNSLDYDNQLAFKESITPSSIYEDHFKNQNNNLIFIGRLTKVKQLDMILDFLRIAKHNNQIYNFTFIGAGVEEQRLKQIVKDYDLEDQVWFYGQCYNEEELSKLIYNADLCVSPGNVGLTAIHCLSYGCPVITHNNFSMQMPEFEVVQSGKTGDFFEYNSVESLNKTIEKWFANKYNRDDIRRASYKIIDESWNPHYQIDIFKSVLM